MYAVCFLLYVVTNKQHTAAYRPRLPSVTFARATVSTITVTPLHKIMILGFDSLNIGQVNILFFYKFSSFNV